MTVIENPLDEVLSLCEAMLASAREQDWVTVANLEVTRSSLLHHLLESEHQPAAESLASALPRILECDRELLRLGEPAHAELAGKILQFRQGQRALSAYGDAGDD